jgi:sulfotransferase family protein
MPICIAGMHRAGTSMVARVLEGCGLDLGGPAHFAPPAPDNRDGYWEDLRFVALNDRILDRLGGAWDHPPALTRGWEALPDLDPERREAEALAGGRAEPWGWKDPRTSLTVPLWKRLLPSLKVVVCVRNPLEVADSLRARGYTSERFGLALWEAYHRTLDEAVDDSFALVTHYHSFLADPRAELTRLLDFTGLRPSPAVRDAVISAASSAARHQRRTSAEVESSGLSGAGKRLYAALCQRSGPVYEAARRREAHPEPAAAAPGERPARGPLEQLEEVRAVLEAREVELASIKPVLVARTEEVDSVKGVLAARDAQLASMEPVLAARETELRAAHEELASIKAVLAARDQEIATFAHELAATRDSLASRERQLLTVRGTLRPLLAALKRRIFTSD